MFKRSFALWAMAALVGSGLPARGQGLPEGEGKQLAETLCVACHETSMITESRGYTREGWENLFTTMVNVPQDLTPVLANYLATNFPEKPIPAGINRPGPASVSISEWIVPTLGSRPHDPHAAEDGSLWWTGQWANVLGRLDVETGEMREFPLPNGAGPHGLAEDLEGNIWYTGNWNGNMGKLDPNTGEVTEYPMPDPAARDPHTPLVTPDGNVWFSVQNADMMGRIVPQTGDVKLVKLNSGDRPYGMNYDSNGVPFIGLRGTNGIISMDPETMEVTEYPLPNPDSRPRRLAITADDMVFFADMPRGDLGRLDPKTGEVKYWVSPGGPESLPYGIATIGNVVWYSESGTRPNTLVRFDPSTEQFQTWTIPSGGGVVRHIMDTEDGNLVLALSGVNRVAYVEVTEGGNTGQ